jgi:hypothetical protein
MEKQELMQRISDRIAQDEVFAAELGSAIDRGTWEIIADFISKIMGIAIARTSQGLELLKELRL